VGSVLGMFDVMFRSVGHDGVNPLQKHLFRNSAALI
jgi:hypothetical protein